MANLFLIVASVLLFSAKEPNDNTLYIPTPTNVSYSWEKVKDFHAPNSPCKYCYLKFFTPKVPGATHYDWEVEATNDSISKTTTKPELLRVYVEPGQVTVRVRARNSSQVSDYYAKNWDIPLPSDCCLH